MKAKKKNKANKQSGLESTVLSSLVQVPNTTITPVSLQLPDAMTEEQWENLGRSIKKWDSFSRWILADWLNFGEQKKYGVIRDLALELNLDENYLSRVKSVGHKVTPERRHENLTFTHHRSVRLVIHFLDTEEEQDRFLTNGLPMRNRTLNWSWRTPSSRPRNRLPKRWRLSQYRSI